ncbi:MAG: hypothetical protein LC772_06900 [Chloroflexi bacterium]|nr:hypothetical protein [Chloroflexota bacterium]
MREIEFEITQDDIDQGLRGSNCLNPAARALTRQRLKGGCVWNVLEFISVPYHVDGYVLGGRGYRNSHELSRFVRGFHAGLPVRPGKYFVVGFTSEGPVRSERFWVYRADGEEIMVLVPPAPDRLTA